MSTAVGVVASTVRPVPGQRIAAAVAAEQHLPPIVSDVLSDAQAAERKRNQARIDQQAVAIDTAAAPANGRDIDCSQLKCVALTFDDGPGGETDKLLKMLSDANAVATWFTLGQVIAANPSNLEKISRAGYEIGDHSWSHPQLTLLGNAAIESQIMRTAREIDSVTGSEPPLMRPPYGSINHRVITELGSLGFPVILWDVDTLDWKYPNPSYVFHSVMRQVHPGSIVLMHDVHPTTVEAVPRILRALASRGYTFVTVSELFGNHLEAGHVYFDNRAAYHPDQSTGADKASRRPQGIGE
jgi:peptidoglycan/xylan/chitin deacetylase (PgdA/CDA1 family)